MRSELDYCIWNNIKEKLTMLYPDLTKSDLIWRHGTKNDMLEMIACKLRKSTKELQAEIDTL